MAACTLPCVDLRCFNMLSVGGTVFIWTIYGGEEERLKHLLCVWSPPYCWSLNVNSSLIIKLASGNGRSDYSDSHQGAEHIRADHIDLGREAIWSGCCGHCSKRRVLVVKDFQNESLGHFWNWATEPSASQRGMICHMFDWPVPMRGNGPLPHSTSAHPTYILLYYILLYNIILNSERQALSLFR